MGRSDDPREWANSGRTSPKPTALTKEQFVERYGGVYEHSPGIAATTYDAGLPADADTVEGLARAMAATVAKGSDDAKLALIRAHPDLAGRLAQAKRLTVESTGEQASVGLDRMSPAEFERFTELNNAYRVRFGFPFVMAVKGRSKAEILTAFTRRLESDAVAETRTALAEIDRIAALRIQDILAQS